MRALGRRAANGLRALDYLYLNPYTTLQALSESLAISLPTATGLVREFLKRGILEEATGQAWGRIYVFGRYLRIFTDLQ